LAQAWPGTAGAAWRQPCRLAARMANLLVLGSVVNERRLRAAPSDGPCGVCRDDGLAMYQQNDSLNRMLSLPGSGADLDWQPPMPPVRFPLRDALMSSHDTPGPLTPQDSKSAASLASATKSKGPLVVKATRKSRAVQDVGHRRRRCPDLGDDVAPQRTPRAPPDCDKAKTAPKAIPSRGSRRRQDELRAAEQAGGGEWPVMQGSKSLPSVSLGNTHGIKDTWKSATRALISHSRRFVGTSTAASEGGTPTVLASNDAATMDVGTMLRSYRSVPRPVKDWAGKGLEFTDAGLGIGARFDQQDANGMSHGFAQRSPGPIYEQHSFGSMSRWASDTALPTRQQCSHHRSGEAYTMGVRREGVRKLPTPSPGMYEVRGFADELKAKAARRPKGDMFAAPDPWDLFG